MSKTNVTAVRRRKQKIRPPAPESAWPPRDPSLIPQLKAVRSSLRELVGSLRANGADAGMIANIIRLEVDEVGHEYALLPPRKTVSEATARQDRAVDGFLNRAMDFVGWDGRDSALAFEIVRAEADRALREAAIPVPPDGETPPPDPGDGRGDEARDSPGPMQASPDPSALRTPRFEGCRLDPVEVDRLSDLFDGLESAKAEAESLCRTLKVDAETFEDDDRRLLFQAARMIAWNVREASEIGLLRAVLATDPMVQGKDVTRLERTRLRPRVVAFGHRLYVATPVDNGDIIEWGEYSDGCWRMQLDIVEDAAFIDLMTPGAGT